MRFMLYKATRAQSHARALHSHPHARTHAHACTNLRVSARAHTHTQKYAVLITFPQQQWLRERASVFRYTYIACLDVHVLYT